MTISHEWIAIGITAIATLAGGALAYGKLSQKVTDTCDGQTKCQAHREQMEEKIFAQLQELAKGVNKIKGKLDLNGD